MTDISMKQIKEITQFWVFYEKETGEPGNIQLSACANNFSVHRGYVSEDGLQCASAIMSCSMWATPASSAP